MRNARCSVNSRAAGFSLIELLVVIFVIIALAAVAFPALGRYVRLFKIRGAQQQVAGAIQEARNRAIAKNANFGVDFVVENSTTYWVHMEDDQSPAHSGEIQPLAYGATSTTQSTRRTLPEGVFFAASAAECPAYVLSAVGATSTSFVPNTASFRYTRLGSMCTTGCTTGGLDAAPVPLSTMFRSSDGIVAVCLYQPDTKLSRALLVSPGGRVRTQQ